MKKTAGIFIVFSIVLSYKCKVTLFVTLPSSLPRHWVMTTGEHLLPQKTIDRIESENVISSFVSCVKAHKETKNLYTRFGDEITIITTIFFFSSVSPFFSHQSVIFFNVGSVFFSLKKNTLSSCHSLGEIVPRFRFSHFYFCIFKKKKSRYIHQY